MEEQQSGDAATSEPFSKLDIGIIGAGVMGQGIALLLARCGHQVIVYDSNADALTRAIEMISDAMTEEILPPPIQSTSLEAMKHCAVIIEAVREDIDVKRALFTALDGVCENAVLATNTSSLSVTKIAASCKKPERVVGWHFFNPVSKMRVAEIIPGLQTAPWVIDLLRQLTEHAGHTALITTDTPGFLINHLGRGYGPEASRIVVEGAADPIDIDRIMRDAHGFRMGPFELYDLTGLDVSHPAICAIHEQYYGEPRYQPTTLLAQRFAGGLLGKKTGKGFYTYSEGRKVEAAERRDDIGDFRPAVWIEPTLDTVAALLANLTALAGMEPNRSSAPDDGSLCVVFPLGTDTATRCAALGLDPRRTVAFDIFAFPTRRRTIMLSPLTDPAYRDAAARLFRADGTPATVIGDSAGFAAQRIIANMVNIACEVAQLHVASPEDIDNGARLGLGYPRGLLRLGDELGASSIFEILKALYALTGEARYRPSSWLRRRVQLGVSLSTPEAAR